MRIAVLIGLRWTTLAFGFAITVAATMSKVEDEAGCYVTEAARCVSCRPAAAADRSSAGSSAGFPPSRRRLPCPHCGPHRPEAVCLWKLLPHHEAPAYQVGVCRPVKLGKIHQNGDFHWRGVTQRTNHGKTQPHIAICRQTGERVTNIAFGKAETRRTGLRRRILAICIEICENEP